MTFESGFSSATAMTLASAGTPLKVTTPFESEKVDEDFFHSVAVNARERPLLAM